MTKQKWFYPLQEKMSKYLNENFKSHCFISQVVTKNRVIETLQVITKDNESKIMESFLNKDNGAIMLYELNTIAIL